MPDPAFLKKLRLLPGQRGLVLAPPSGYLDRLTPAPVDEAPDAAQPTGYDFVQIFVRNSAELARLTPIAQQACRYDGILWVCYPKLTGPLAGDLSRDHLWELMKPTGLDPVTQIAIDETWSALRFRPSERVGAAKA